MVTRGRMRALGSASYDAELTPSTRSKDEGRVRMSLHGEYQWLTSSFEDYMGSLVRLSPEVILGRYLAVITLDGGTPSLTEKREALGWQYRAEVAYSPPIQSVDELYYQRDGVPGFDEVPLRQADRDIGRNHSRQSVRGGEYAWTLQGPEICWMAWIHDRLRSHIVWTALGD
jgi:hypothetical protein